MNAFDTSGIRLTAAAARLANRYFGTLAAMDEADVLSARQVWYAAVSAAECMQLSHQDIAAVREQGAGDALIVRLKTVGRTDAQFYLDLVPKWLKAHRARTNPPFQITDKKEQGLICYQS